MINNSLTYISLFSSAGVGCYGFKKAGYKCIATNERIYRRLIRNVILKQDMLLEI